MRNFVRCFIWKSRRTASVCILLSMLSTSFFYDLDKSHYDPNPPTIIAAEASSIGIGRSCYKCNTTTNVVQFAKHRDR